MPWPRRRAANWIRCCRGWTATPARWKRRKNGLFALRALARKYGVTPEALPALREEFAAKQEALVTGGSQIKQAETRVAAGRDAYLMAARKLSKARDGAAKKLEAAVAGELAPLKLGHAKFRVALDRLDDDQGAAGGLEKIAFEIATVEGAAFGGLAKIASGGELARFSLALTSGAGPGLLACRHGVRRSGPGRRRGGGRCGGRAAATAGRNHPGAAGDPQPPGRGPRGAALPHHPGERQDENRTADDAERLEEIARMLSGANVTDEARAAARRLMAEAAAPAKRKRARTA